MFIKMDNSIEGVLTKIANIWGTRERSSKQSKRLQKSRIKVAEHNLLGCESLLFIGVLFKTRCRYKAQDFDRCHGNMDGLKQA